MSRKSLVSQARSVANTDLQATELNSRDLQRERLQTQKGFKYTLDIKVAAFEKETKALSRAIQEAQDGNSIYAEAAFISLQVITKGYRSSFQDLEALFSTDRLGESDEIARKIRDLARAAIDSAEQQIELLSKNFTNPIKPGESILHNIDKHPPHTYAASRDSNPFPKSSSNKPSRSSRSTLSSTKLKAMVDVVAEKEQADYDLVIAKKEWRDDYEPNYTHKKRTQEWIRDQQTQSKQAMRDDLDLDRILEGRTVVRDSKPSNLAEAAKY